MNYTADSTDLPTPIHQLLDQVNWAARHQLHLIAIGMACAIPAIFASLAMKSGRSGGREYRAWCKENLTNGKFAYLTPDDLYSIRCGVLHQGRFGDLKNNVARVIFVPQGSGLIENCIIGDAYIYSVVEFCEYLTEAASAWYGANRNDPVVAANTEHMMQYYPKGLPPYVAGAPVIA